MIGLPILFDESLGSNLVENTVGAQLLIKYYPKPTVVEMEWLHNLATSNIQALLKICFKKLKLRLRKMETFLIERFRLNYTSISVWLIS